jgi:hypothetical protein
VVFAAPVADDVVGAEGNAAEDVLGVDEATCLVVGEVAGWKEKLKIESVGILRKSLKIESEEGKCLSFSRFY